MLSKSGLNTTREAIGIQQLSLFNRHISTLLPNSSHIFTLTHHQNSFCNHQSLCYRKLFSRLKSPPNLFETKILHSLLIVNGFFHPNTTDRVLGSQLVNIYVNYGCLPEALLVFKRLPQKGNIAWNAILRGFVDVGRFSEAIEFYHLMLRRGVIPDNFTYPIVLRACSGLSALEEGRRVQELIQFNEIHRNMKRNVYVECAMIDMFAKCGSLDEARRLFDEMPRKDLASWSAMICGTIQNGKWFEALCLFRRMRSEGLLPDSVIVAAILPACARLEARHMGMALQGCTVRSGFESDLYVSNALMDMYCKCGDTHDAHRIFDYMVCKDAVSWSTLISGYSQNCLYHDSLELYLKMKSAGIRTNAIIVASVLPGLAKLKLLKQGKEMHNYILKQGFESDVVIGSALIDMYANCGSVREAECIFEIMSDTNISIWNSMIVGYSLNGDIDSALVVLRRIGESKLRPNSITVVSTLPVCTRMGHLRQGKEIHGYAIRSSLGKLVSIGNSLIDMYCKCGYLVLGVKFFNLMMEKNIVTYNTIISAHGIHGRGERAVALFEQMNEAKIRPNKVTFIALLSACSHAGLVDRGWLLYNSMIDDYNILPDMEHYSCMVDLLGRAGHLDEAFNFIRRMPVDPDINVLGSLLGACRLSNKLELAEHVGQHIFQENLKDSGYYVLLSNIYASTKRWEEALTVRKMIKEKGLIKKPGSSWIQVGCCIHMFHATDRMRPEFNKTEEILDCLLLEMKDEGYVPDPCFLSHDLVGDADDKINFDVSSKS